jgi:hypothetical protein
MIVIDLSPGLVSATFELLGILERKPLSFTEVLYSFPKIGVCRTSVLIETVQTLNWAETSAEGTAALTASGGRLKACENNQSQLRQAILDFIDVVNPDWVQNAPFGRAKVVEFAPRGIRQIFHESGLSTSTDDDIVAFWDSLAARARGQSNAWLTEIGREGEKMTLKYEENRTGRAPIWVSLDNNADGYDVRSIVDRKTEATLSIEVKATKMNSGAVFHLSRNEWKTASIRKNYVVHLWRLSDDPPRLAVVSKSELEQHVPMNQGKGLWESMLVPFDAFSHRFGAPPSPT